MVLMSMPWCQSIKTTKAEACIFMITAKAHLAEECKWLDGNLSILYTQFHKQNPMFTPDIDNHIPTHQDKCRKTTVYAIDADIMKHSITNGSN